MTVERAQIILVNVLQQIYDYTFDCNYDEFYKYITLELGITDEDIKSLRDNDNYIRDINGNLL